MLGWSTRFPKEYIRYVPGKAGDEATIRYTTGTEPLPVLELLALQQRRQHIDTRSFIGHNSVSSIISSRIACITCIAIYVSSHASPDRLRH